MGVFPEDEEIRTSRLINLWVVEGFLKPVSKKRMEETAKEYLEDLIGRNLILVHGLGTTGNIKECKVHDLLRDLCLREAQKERFYIVVASPASRSQQIVYASQRRIVVSSFTSEDEAINALSSMPLARSLIWNLDNQELPPLNFMRLLRILELSSLYVTLKKPCLESMHQLVNSRYLNILASRCPHSIGRFWNLQTLYCDVQLPTTFIWDMILMRHIQSDELMDLDNDQLQDGNNVLGNLQTLARIKNFKCSQQVVKRIPNIKKLKIYYTELDDRHCLTNLVCIDKLESLNCVLRQSGSHYLQRLISFPNSLIKLKLQIEPCQCLQDILDKVGALPLLQKLRLISGSFKEGQWETTEGQFHSLKYLAIHWCKGLQVWKTESSHFPCLDHHILYGLNELEEIPLDFAEISTLQVIEVAGCSDSVVVSAQKIAEEQQELYGEEAALQVQVKLSRNYDTMIMSLTSPNLLHGSKTKV